MSMTARKPRAGTANRPRRQSVRRNLETLFLQHLPQIVQVAESACRRVGLLPQDTEDFVSQTKVKLIENDYAVLARYRGDSRLTTYLTTVIHNQLKDFCNSRWGKFRPSAAAKRLGPAALALERLLELEGHGLESAIELLRQNDRLGVSQQELRRIAAELPRRSQRQFFSIDMLAQQAAQGTESRADFRLQSRERSITAKQVEEVLNLALETLSAQDLLVLKMHFRSGCTFAEIAKALGLKQRSLYSRKEKCLTSLKAAFEARGLIWEQVREILGWQGHEIRARFQPRPRVRTASHATEKDHVRA